MEDAKASFKAVDEKETDQATPATPAAKTDQNAPTATKTEDFKTKESKRSKKTKRKQAKQAAATNKTQANIYTELANKTDEPDDDDFDIVEPPAVKWPVKEMTWMEPQTPYNPPLAQAARLAELGKLTKTTTLDQLDIEGWERLLQVDDGITTPDGHTIARLLGGRRNHTPANGNCQPYAIAELLMQASITNPETRDQGIQMTSIIKKVMATCFSPGRPSRSQAMQRCLPQTRQ